MGKIIGIISDTHDCLPKIKQVVAELNAHNVDLVLHAGDLVSPFTAKVFSDLNAKMICVFGNNDGDKEGLKEKFEGIAEFYEPPHTFTYQGKKFALTHKLDADLDTDILIYGHTHSMHIDYNKKICLNPGEVCGYLTLESTYLCLDLSDLSIRRCYLED